MGQQTAEWLERRFGAHVTWLPFDLHPEYPAAGLPRERLLERYGEEGIERTRRMFQAVGLSYNPNPDVVPNTSHALRLTELARERGVQRAVHDRLMDAYWDEGANIGDPEALRALVTETGLDAADVDDVLAGDAFAEHVRGSTAEANAAGIHAVPAFVIDRRLLVLGAQPHEVFESALAQLRADPPIA